MIRALAAAAVAALVWTGVGGTSTKTADAVTIQWVGDTVLASAYGTPPNGGRDSLTRVAHSLGLADLTWGNLEETFSVGGSSKCGSSSDNCYAFQAPPAFAPNLTAAGFDLMNLANNHANDFGSSGLAQTHAALRRAHLRWTGGPGQFTILSRNGVRVAFLGFAPCPWPTPRESSPAITTSASEGRSA